MLTYSVLWRYLVGNPEESIFAGYLIFGLWENDHDSMGGTNSIPSLSSPLLSPHHVFLRDLTTGGRLGTAPILTRRGPTSPTPAQRWMVPRRLRRRQRDVQRAAVPTGGAPSALRPLWIYLALCPLFLFAATPRFHCASFSSSPVFLGSGSKPSVG